LQPQQDPQLVQLQQQMQKMQQYIQSGQVDKTNSETQKNLAIAQRTKAEIPGHIISASKTAKEGNVTDAQVAKTHAETIKTLEEAKRTAIEAAYLPKDNKVNIEFRR